MLRTRIVTGREGRGGTVAGALGVLGALEVLGLIEGALSSIMTG